ncbi:MAG TPA: type II toxin-antitoxin system PemK/MazF family toxin [Gemmatimonadales bacterium]|nr:type II toxin-antitoxin system PemK/MazF family toxin [Gemmatimonadales bacterium]
MKKTRPCAVVSPDELNTHLHTFIVALVTTGSHAYPFRVPCRFAGKGGHIVLDQVRTVDRGRLVRHVGRLAPGTLAGSRTGRRAGDVFAPEPSTIATHQERGDGGAPSRGSAH